MAQFTVHITIMHYTHNAVGSIELKELYRCSSLEAALKAEATAKLDAASSDFIDWCDYSRWEATTEEEEYAINVAGFRFDHNGVLVEDKYDLECDIPF